MSLWLSLGTALALGAASGAHCAAMCGPLAAVGCAKGGRLSGERAGGYLGGRLAGYAAGGALAGGLGAPLVAGQAGTFVRIAAALIVGAALLARAAALLRPAGAPPLVQLRRGSAAPGGALAKLAPLVPRRGLGLGLATAIFPCGALAGALLAAAASGSAATGAAMMAVFSLASAPLLMLPALIGHRVGPLLAHGWARRASALALITVAAWVIAPPLVAAARPAPAACCAHR